MADDIAADTFVIALRKRDGFDPRRGTVRAWLYEIATNLAARQQRAEQRRYRALARAAARDIADRQEERVVSWVAAAGLQPQIATDELNMIRVLLDEAPPSAEVIAEGRRRIAASAAEPGPRPSAALARRPGLPLASGRPVQPFQA